MMQELFLRCCSKERIQVLKNHWETHQGYPPSMYNIAQSLKHQIQAWRARRAHAFSSSPSAVDATVQESSDHVIPYDMHWFLHVGFPTSSGGRHSLCFWEVKEKILIHPTEQVPRHTSVVKIFLFDANKGLFEVETTDDIDYFVGTYIQRAYGFGSGDVQCHFYDG